MSDRFVLIFALALFGVILADWLSNSGAIGFFMLRKVADLVEYLAFWR